jgi:hypothetical protein
MKSFGEKNDCDLEDSRVINIITDIQLLAFHKRTVLAHKLGMCSRLIRFQRCEWYSLVFQKTFS